MKIIITIIIKRNEELSSCSPKEFAPDRPPPQSGEMTSVGFCGSAAKVESSRKPKTLKIRLD